MPRRWSLNTRLWAYRYLTLRDGEECAFCHRSSPLDIDHIDGNSKNNDPANLRLLCRRCNTRMSKLDPRLQKELHQEISARNMRVCGCAETQLVKSAVSYVEGSPEMQANHLFEIKFRKWLLGEIGKQGGYLKEEAIAAGAERVGCSTATTSRYLQKLTSGVGPLTIQKDALGNPALIFKERGRK